MHFPKESIGLESEIEWFLDYLVNERGSSKHTVVAYQADLVHFSAFLSGLGLTQWSECREIELLQYRSVLHSSGLASTSISRKLSAIRSFLKFLTRNTDLAEVAIDGLSIARKKQLPKALTLEQIDLIFSVPNLKTPSGLRDRTMLEILYGAGLRVSELTMLRVEDCELSNSSIRVLGKREKSRIIPLPSTTESWLRRYMNEARSVLLKKATSIVFINNRGSCWSRSGVFRMLRRYTSAAGVNTQIGPHVLRHSYAVHLVQAGADLRSVQELLGHDSISTTEVYTHLDMETVKQIYSEAHPRAKKRQDNILTERKNQGN